VGFGLYTVELNSLLRIVTLNTLQTVEEIKVPPGTTKFTVGHHMQATGALLLDNMADRLILNRTKLPGINFAAGEFQASLFDGIRT
jgi:hypothetical protein